MDMLTEEGNGIVLLPHIVPSRALPFTTELPHLVGGDNNSTSDSDESYSSAAREVVPAGPRHGPRRRRRYRYCHFDKIGADEDTDEDVPCCGDPTCIVHSRKTVLRVSFRAFPMAAGIMSRLDFSGLVGVGIPVINIEAIPIDEESSKVLLYHRGSWSECMAAIVNAGERGPRPICKQ
jgi:hypothetical protein